MKRIAYANPALRQLRRLDAKVRAQIEAKLVRYAATGAGDLKRMSGREGSRLRVGDWRVIFDENATTITVLAVGNRRDIYD